MASVVVRRASRADLGALTALYEELADAKITAVPGDRATSERLLAEILADPRRELAVALVDGQLVGTADPVSYTHLSYRAFLLAVPFMQGALFVAVTAGVDLARDIESGFFNRLAMTPVRASAMLAGQMGGPCLLYTSRCV